LPDVCFLPAFSYSTSCKKMDKLLAAPYSWIYFELPYGFNAYFWFVREEDKHLVRWIIIVCNQNNKIRSMINPFVFHYTLIRIKNLTRLWYSPGRRLFTRFISKLSFKLIQGLVQFILCNLKFSPACVIILEKNRSNFFHSYQITSIVTKRHDRFSYPPKFVSFCFVIHFKFFKYIIYYRTFLFWKNWRKMRFFVEKLLHRPSIMPKIHKNKNKNKSCVQIPIRRIRSRHQQTQLDWHNIDFNF